MASVHMLQSVFMTMEIYHDGKDMILDLNNNNSSGMYTTTVRSTAKTKENK